MRSSGHFELGFQVRALLVGYLGLSLGIHLCNYQS